VSIPETLAPEAAVLAAAPGVPRRRSAVARWLGAALALSAAAALVGASRLPFWEMALKAPQYPDGLKLTVYLDRIEGDVDEVDSLNHYIGVGKIADGAKFERAVSMPGIYAMGAILVLAPVVGRRKFWLLATPVVLFPIIFAVDLKYWMHRLSTDLDPHAPFKMKPFSFALFGESKVAQFVSTTSFSAGYWIVVGAALAALAALLLRDGVGCSSCARRATCGAACSAVIPWSRS